MTDIVGSTERAAEMGDSAWRHTTSAHLSDVERLVARHGGQLIKITGDGALTSFQGPCRAIAYARDMRDAAVRLRLELRAGIHTAECLRRGAGISGISVAIAARIADQAGPGEVRVSSTVRDLVVGSGLGFDTLGEVELKGVPGTWQIARLLP